MNLPEEIENTFLELAAFDERIKSRRARVRSIELQITLDVTTAKDPTTGKLLLSNEKQREAVIAQALADESEYAELAEQLSNLEQDRLRLQARLERLRMEFKVEMLEAEQRNHLAALKVADAIYSARTSASWVDGQHQPRHIEAEIELPF